MKQLAQVQIIKGIGLVVAKCMRIILFPVQELTASAVEICQANQLFKPGCACGFYMHTRIHTRTLS